MRLVGRTQQSHPVHHPPPFGFVLVAYLFGRATLVAGALDDLVVDVGDVLRVTDREPRPLEVATQYVIGERIATVSQMGKSVDRRPTVVHGELARDAGGDLHQPPVGSVVQLQCWHGVQPRSGSATPLDQFRELRTRANFPRGHTICNS